MIWLRRRLRSRSVSKHARTSVGTRSSAPIHHPTAGPTRWSSAASTTRGHRTEARGIVGRCAESAGARDAQRSRKTSQRAIGLVGLLRRSAGALWGGWRRDDDSLDDPLSTIEVNPNVHPNVRRKAQQRDFWWQLDHRDVYDFLRTILNVERNVERFGGRRDDDAERLSVDF